MGHDIKPNLLSWLIKCSIVILSIHVHKVKRAGSERQIVTIKKKKKKSLTSTDDDTKSYKTPSINGNNQ